MTRPLFALLAALSLAACGNTEAKAPATAARPAMWKVADADTTIYLFGTIHLLPKGLKWTTPAMTKAMAASQALVLEVALDKDPEVLGAVMMKLAKTPGLPPILDRIEPAKRAALQKVIADSSLSPTYLDGLETWAAAGDADDHGVISGTDAEGACRGWMPGMPGRVFRCEVQVRGDLAEHLYKKAREEGLAAAWAEAVETRYQTAWPRPRKLGLAPAALRPVLLNHLRTWLAVADPWPDGASPAFPKKKRSPRKVWPPRKT